MRQITHSDELNSIWNRALIVLQTVSQDTPNLCYSLFFLLLLIFLHLYNLYSRGTTLRVQIFDYARKSTYYLIYCFIFDFLTRGYKNIYVPFSWAWNVPAHKCYNANKCCHFNIYDLRAGKIVFEAYLILKNADFYIFSYLWAFKISCLAELSMEKKLSSRPDFLMFKNRDRGR